MFKQHYAMFYKPPATISTLHPAVSIYNTLTRALKCN